jgi:hypothetical protein
LGKLTFIFNILIIFLYFIEVICFDWLLVQIGIQWNVITLEFKEVG